MATLGSLLFALLAPLWTTVVLIAGLPVLLAPRHIAYRYGEFWAGGVLFLARRLCGIKHAVEGLEHLPEGPFILAAKHQSAWDTFIFPLILEGEPAYVLKKELTHVPLFGWYLKATEMIPVDRAAGAKALKTMLAAAEKAAGEGRAIIIYPEGTRTKPGQSLPYHPGVAALYRHLDLPVVPVALNSGLFWPKRAIFKKPGTIRLKFLPPIPPGLTRKAFMARLGDAIEGESQILSQVS